MMKPTKHALYNIYLSYCSYMVLFLKFISSVIPTIEYDYTMASGVL